MVYVNTSTSSTECCKPGMVYLESSNETRNQQVDKPGMVYLESSASETRQNELSKPSLVYLEGRTQGEGRVFIESESRQEESKALNLHPSSMDNMVLLSGSDQQVGFF